jgi:manganese efflux pump family protein
LSTLLLLAVALSMDAFAAALSHGAAARSRPGASEALRVGLAFGSAQALMPLLGWALGIAFISIIRDVDHWVAFVLLGLIGGRMVREGLRADNAASAPRSGKWALLTAAIATSIDAAAAGVTLPVLDQPILLACAVIGAVTLILSTTGVFIGKIAGALIGRRAEVLGGLVLIGIGAKILVEHVYFGA